MLPFIPGGIWNLDNLTASLNGTYPTKNYKEYDIHSLNGHLSGMVVN